MRRPVFFCRAFSGLLGVCCFFWGVKGVRLIPGDCFSGRFVMSCFSGVFGVFSACSVFPRRPGETLLRRESFVNELSANRRYRKICYYESGGIVFLSYFIVFLVGAWSACRGRLLKKMGYDLRAKLFSFVSGLPGRDLLLPLHN